MKTKMKHVLFPLMLLAIVCLFCACGKNGTLEQLDEDGYSVSVKFDANGGEFAEFVYSVMDSYNISGMTAGEDGMLHLTLLTPDNENRGSINAHKATNGSLFLAGWQQRIETVDAEGNVSYTYKMWDFEKDTLEVDPSKEYSASEPVLTLYAVWVPLFEVNFIDAETQEILTTEKYNPLSEDEELVYPVWKTDKGTLTYYKFPEKDGCTFNGAYYDAACTQPVELTDRGTLVHTGSIDPDTGLAENSSMNVYVTYIEGEWEHVFSAKQFARYGKADGLYVLCADLDFTGYDWPFAGMEFTGTLISEEGHCYTISNVSISQTTDDTYFGLFGSVSADAVLKNIQFQNITVRIEKGAQKGTHYYGLFAGYIDAAAQISGVSIADSTLQIDTAAKLPDTVYMYIISRGDSSKISAENLTAKMTGANSETMEAVIDASGIVTVAEKP